MSSPRRRGFYMFVLNNNNRSSKIFFVSKGSSKILEAKLQYRGKILVELRITI